MQSKEFEAAVARHRESLERFVTFMVGAEADEIAGEAIATAWQQIARFEGRSRFSTWLLGIARNLCRARLRERRRAAAPTSPEDLEAIARTARGVLTSMVRHELAERLEFCVSRLPTAMREAFVLHYVEGLGYAEVGAIAGVSEGAARVRAHRARALLREELGAAVDTTWR